MIRSRADQASARSATAASNPLPWQRAGACAFVVYVVTNLVLLNSFHVSEMNASLQLSNLRTILQNSIRSGASSIRGDASSSPTDRERKAARRRVLAAYLEPIDQSDWQIKPLPKRNTTASSLTEKTYPGVTSCTKLPEQWPVDEPPTDQDPFLPWIHDVFPTANGKHIQFVAQNRRRCQSGTAFGELKKFLQPNVALFQHVPVKRIDSEDEEGETRYRLSTHEEADDDGMETRFICRFSNGEETLSVYNFNYDWHSKRKGYKYTFTEDGFDNHMIWSSQLQFKCPVPPSLVETVKSGLSVVDDYATLFVDVVPIRTPPRYGYPNQFLPPKYGKPYTFIAQEEFGDSHILPRVEDSGRWANIPICKPSLQTYVDGAPDTSTSASPQHALIQNTNNDVAITDDSPALQKRFDLVSCVWTSASFHTRGGRRHITDNSRRLREWLEFHLMTGFDHIFVYDNSFAQDGDIDSLEPITDLFPGQVTRIHWPSKVCNNNPGSGDNKGERSSQYAAESSCRLRFGVHANWIGAFDIDEYMVPMGDHSSMKDVLADAHSRGKNILNFRSMRAWPRKELLSDPSNPEVDEDRTFLQTYNCDPEKPPRQNTLPAEKEIYRSDYVLLHFVHYSTVTSVSVLSQNETMQAGLKWKDRYGEGAVETPDELEAAVMLHSKSVTGEDTKSWEHRCKTPVYSQTLFKMNKRNVRGHFDSCKIGIPFPPDAEPSQTGPVLTDDEGYTCNCFVNQKLEKHWIPKLEAALEKRGNVEL